MKSRNKKILFVYYKLFKPGGITRVLTSLANELVENGYEVTILVLMSEHKSFYPLNPKVKLIFIDAFAHWAFSKVCVGINKYLNFIPKKQNIKNYFYDYAAYSTLNEWINKNHQNYDVIISCWYKLSIDLAINKKVRKKTLAWEHTNYKIGGSFYNRFKYKYRNLKGVVYLSSPGKDFYEKLNPNSKLIPNIIGNPFEGAQPINSENKKNVITTVGRLFSTKNISALVDIFSSLKDKKDWQLNIIGGGEEFKKLENQIKTLHLQDSIKLLGEKNSEEVFEYLKESKIFAMTSTIEGLPLVLIEAMFCSNILIAYDCETGPSDIITEDNGFLISLHDKQTFVEKFQLLINEEGLMNKLIKSSYLEANKWRKNQILEKWERVLN